MAPLTRMRAGASGVPNDLLVEHYAQRAGLGLIITEGTYPRAASQAFVGQPGIVDDAQQAGWARVAEAVHARGGKIVMQVMHGGRVTHPDVNGGRDVEAPSAIAIQGEGHTEQGKQAYPLPKALTTDGLREVRDDFVAASVRAIEAGLDGVEPARRQRLPAARVPVARVEPAHRRVRRLAGEPRPLRGRGRHRRRRGRRRRQGRAAHLPRARHPGRARDRPRRRPRDLRHAARPAWPRSAWPTCRCCTASRPVTWCRSLRRRFGGPLVANSGFSSATTRDEAAHHRVRPRGRRRRRPRGHRQPRPRRALARRARRERARPEHVLRRRRARVHRLPVPHRERRRRAVVPAGVRRRGTHRPAPGAARAGGRRRAAPRDATTTPGASATRRRRRRP
nr:hypothetical protein [Angustibacter aerolatus]